MKIEQRITSTFVKAFMAVFISVAFIIGITTAFILTQQAYRFIQTASSTKAEFLRSYLNSQREIVIALGGASVFRDLLNESSGSATYLPIKKKVDDRLVRTIKLDNNLNELYLVNTHAKILSSSNPEHTNADVSTNIFFTEGKKGTYIRDIYFSTITNSLAWGISTPITEDKTGRLLGVIIARFETKPLFDLVRSQPNLGKTSETFIINRNLYLQTPSRYQNSTIVLKKIINTQNATDCFNPKETEKVSNSSFYSAETSYTKFYRDYRNIFTLGTHAYIPETHWCLITKVDAFEILTPVLGVGLMFLGSTMLGVFVFSLVSAQISRNITNPIEQLYKGIQEIQKGNVSYKLEINSSDEVGILSRQFESLMTSLNETRATIDQKVKDQTAEIINKTKNLEDQKKAILNILEDVELEKNKVDQLAQDLQKFELAVENANDHIVITDPEGIILFANKSVERITGYSLSEVKGKKAGNKQLWGGLMPNEFYVKLWKTIKTDKKPQIIEIKNRRKNGDIYITKASISPVINKGGEIDYFVGIERDVTKEVEVDKMKTEFISLASHQLRTPLSAMRWFAEMLLNGDMGKLSDEQTEAIHNIYASNERMIALVNSLLNISRIESGRIIVDPKPTDMKILVADVVNGLKKKLEEKNQTIVLTVHPQLPLVSLDEKLIHEVYTNLLTNAIKYSPKNTEIIVSISKKDTELISQVSDNGFGIPERQKEKIFQKFFRADNIVKKETDGTGLGLYLVKSIIESSHGKIWFESTENKGTSFWFTLPMSGMAKKKGDVSLS